MEPSHWTEKVRDSLRTEIDRDAAQIAVELFGTHQPDADSITDAAYDDEVRGAYSREDRGWLMEAQRSNPEAFLASFKRLGGIMPPPSLEP